LGDKYVKNILKAGCFTPAENSIQPEKQGIYNLL